MAEHILVELLAQVEMAVVEQALIQEQVQQEQPTQVVVVVVALEMGQLVMLVVLEVQE